jgi:transposase
MLLTNPTDHPPDCPFLSPPEHTLGTRRTSPPRPWAPLTDDEWAVLSPFVLRSSGPGRPLRDPRKALDAIFWLAARPQRALPPWRVLPPEFGKPDTAARRFRRWAEAGLWSRLLRALADPEYPGIAVLRRLESWICRTYRRAWRILGVPGVALARRLGFLSALRAPSVFLPDLDLSDRVIPLTQVRPRRRISGIGDARHAFAPPPRRREPEQSPAAVGAGVLQALPR